MMNCFQFNNFYTPGWSVINGYNYYVYAWRLSYSQTNEPMDHVLNLSKDSMFLNEKRIFENADVAYVPKSKNEVETGRGYTQEQTDHPLDLSKATTASKLVIDEKYLTTTQTVDKQFGTKYTRRLIYCNLCPFQTDHKNNLRKHVIGAHSEADNVECPKCGKLSKHKYSLAVHLNYCGKEPRFQCAYCPQKYIKRDYLQRHVLKKHVDELSTQVKPKAPVTRSPPDDQNSYTPASSLKNVKVQLKFNAKECPCCGRKFNYWGHMHRHYKSCFANCIQCKYCPYKVKDSTMLQMHISTAHLNIASKQVSALESTVKTEPI